MTIEALYFSRRGDDVYIDTPWWDKVIFATVFMDASDDLVTGEDGTITIKVANGEATYRIEYEDEQTIHASLVSGWKDPE